ncbi:MAG: PHP domain-containing protein [Candidatus Krumholzibacteria bacterium]
MEADSGIPTFTHLHVHSSYSLGIGLSTPVQICAHAQRAGYKAVALTDTNNTYGFIEFHLAARNYNLKPIYGAVVHHTSLVEAGRDRFPMALIALSRRGLANVTALTSLSATAYECGVALSREQLDEHHEDVVALVGTVRSEVSTLAHTGDDDNARVVIKSLHEIFGDNFFVEIQDHGDSEEKLHAQKLLELCRACGTRAALTQEVRYVSDEMKSVYELVRGVQNPHEQDDFFKMGQHLPDRSLRPPAELVRLYDIYPAAYEAAAEIEQRVEGDLLEGIAHPASLIKPPADAKQELLVRCTEGFYEHYRNLTHSQSLQYRSIIKQEIDQIGASGLLADFLLWQDVFGRLRRSGITLGPASGLALQSFCAHVLGITSYNPYEYDTGFHPMFDTHRGEVEIQLPAESRESALRILREALGEHSLVHAPVIERVTPARAVRMVAKVLEVGEGDLGDVLAIIARNPGVSLKSLCENDRQLGSVYKRSIPVREMLTRASLLEHLPCGIIRSRRSVTLAAVDLRDFLAHSVDERSGDTFIHASRDTLPIGAVYRIDFTPLTALGVARRTRQRLRIPDDGAYGRDQLQGADATVWRAVREGETTGVFLFEGQILQQHRESVQLDSMDDLTNFLALMRVRDDQKMIADRLKEYQAGAIYSDADPREVFRILRRTHGFILYNEQLRDILSFLTGKSPDEAERMLEGLRSANPRLLASFRSEFMRGMADRDLPMEAATRWFERFLFYVNQTMRRERVFADALLVYELFFFKVRHRGVFYVALLNTHAENADKRQVYLDYLSNQDMVLALDINRSEVAFTTEDGRIRTGFCAVSGLEPSAGEFIVRVRGKKGFASIDDFVQRLGRKGISREAVRNLIRAGAFDSFGGTKGDLNKALMHLLRPDAARKPKTRDRGQFELPFDS